MLGDIEDIACCLGVRRRWGNRGPFDIRVPHTARVVGWPRRRNDDLSVGFNTRHWWWNLRIRLGAKEVSVFVTPKKRRYR